MTRYEHYKRFYGDGNMREVAEERIVIRETCTSVGPRRFYVCDDNEKFESRTSALIHEVAWLMKEW